MNISGYLTKFMEVLAQRPSEAYLVCVYNCGEGLTGKFGGPNKRGGRTTEIFGDVRSIPLGVPRGNRYVEQAVYLEVYFYLCWGEKCCRR